MDTQRAEDRKSGNLSETAYSIIRGQLREGVIKPGERIRERELAERLDLGRTPIREPLKRLESEGILEQTAELGLIHRKLSQTEIVEMHQVSAVLVGLAMRAAAQMATDPEIQTMQLLLKRLGAAAASETDALHAAHKLDQVIYTAARNGYLLQHLRLIEDKLGLQLSGRSTFGRPERRHAFFEDMQDAVAAIALRDGERAERAGRRRSEHGMLARLELDAEITEATLPGRIF